MTALNQDLINMVRGPIMRTWETIASDLEEANSQCGEGPMTNIIAMECVIDANYLTMYGGEDGKRVDDLISQVIQANDYDTVLKYLSDNIRL